MTAILAPKRFIAPFEPGDHLDQKTFHRLYDAMPPHIRAELINGVVHMPAALKLPHSDGCVDIFRWLVAYHDSTEGVRISENATVVFGPDDEMQPDYNLRIAPECGGRTREIKEYIHGPPELAVEIAVSTVAIDLFEKKLAYAKHGVAEYLAYAKLEKKVYWFANRGGVFEPLEAKDGILRSEVFPGLWLDVDGLVRRDRKQMLAVLKRGLSTKKHREFVQRLAQK